MEKLQMCRICLVANVPMNIVINKNLHQVYEKLTDIPFITEDRRPVLSCLFCCTKLKQCYGLLRQCLEAENLFTQMMNEPNQLINQDHLEYFGGLNKSPTEKIRCTVDVVQTESIAIKDELPAACERLYDIIEPKQELQSDELEVGIFDYNGLHVTQADTPAHHSESDLADDVPLMEFKTEVEEQVESKNKQRARETTKIEVEIFDNSGLDVADIEDDVPLMEFKTEVEEQAVSKNKQRARETRAAVAEKPKLETRRKKLEDTITADETKKEKSDLKVIWTNQKRTPKPGTYFKEPYNFDQRCFRPKDDLTKHIRIHTDEKPYKCDVCQRSFTIKGNLTKHTRLHTGVKPFKCDVCQRSFSVKDTLLGHIRTHTVEKPYKCDVCQRSFSVKSSLLGHIRIHTGEKPYKCDVCQRSFSQMGHLTQHVRKHTGEKSYKAHSLYY